MQALYPRPDEHAAIRTDLKAIFVSLELSRSTWVITSLSPGGGEKMSKHAVPSGDIPALLARLAPGALVPAPGESPRPDGAGLSHHRHPRSGAGRVLDPPGPATGRDREPCRRSRLDRDIPAASAGEDRQDRWRSPGSRPAGLQARRAPGLCDGPGPDPTRGGSAPDQS